jgi:hypothetical protein
MKRLALLFALTLFCSSLGADELLDRDVLLTPEGVLYTVGTVRTEVANGESRYHLLLAVQDGDERWTEAVPASVAGGAHSNPALAYDAESRTLFLFWQETLYRGLSSRLLFVSLQNRKWSEVSELDSVEWKLRRNLRIAVTRTIESTNDQNQPVQVPQVVVHAVWWEESGAGEFARYAMLGIDNGVVTTKEFRYLLEFNGTSVDRAASEGVVTTSNEALRHPAVQTTPARDAVDVVFGDAGANSLHRLRIRPVLDGRLRIPIGVRGRNMRDMQLTVTEGGRVAALIDDESVTMYTVAEGRVGYAIYRDGRWSLQRSIALSEDINAATAIDALRRMAAAQ